MSPPNFLTSLCILIEIGEETPFTVNYAFYDDFFLRVTSAMLEARRLNSDYE